MTNCPTCGQPVPAKPLMDAPSLLAAMDGDCDVYKGRDGNWYVTYGGGQASNQAVHTLRVKGEIEPTYPDCLDCYSLPSRAADVRHKIAARGARRSAKADQRKLEGWRK
jgi:hypothetical protein